MPDESQKPKRRRGGQPGNLNALKHGRHSNLYERVMTTGQRKGLAIAREMRIDDLKSEADAIRTYASELADKITPRELPLFAELMRTLCRVAATHFNLNRQQAGDLEDTMFQVFADIRRTMGED